MTLIQPKIMETLQIQKVLSQSLPPQLSQQEGVGGDVEEGVVLEAKEMQLLGVLLKERLEEGEELEEGGRGQLYLKPHLHLISHHRHVR